MIKKECRLPPQNQDEVIISDNLYWVLSAGRQILPSKEKQNEMKLLLIVSIPCVWAWTSHIQSSDKLLVQSKQKPLASHK